MNDNLLTSYSFLAALSENDSDIYKTVYLPLFKRAMSLYAKNNTTGTDINIQEIIEKEYGITVPIVIVRKLIKAVANDLSRKELKSSNFKLYNNGQSFEFASITFKKIEDIYQRGRRRANLLQEAFEDYIIKEHEDNTEVPSFACFIDKNKRKLSSFFSGAINKIDNNRLEVSFMPHVNFLQHIENKYHELYETAEHIYLGSMIASYLESGVDLEPKVADSITYYFDTQIILEALDLQNDEDTQPTKELLNLIKHTGGKAKVLDITLSEITKVIETSINNYNKTNPTTTINQACIRIGKNKAWLINLCGKLEQHLENNLQIHLENISESKIKEYSSTDDCELLEKTRFKKATAAHDVISYLHVRERRKENVRFFQKAKYWFVTANKPLFFFNISRRTQGFVNEIIMPEELTSLLFLKNPTKFSKAASKIGLNELVAQTLSEEHASKELINDFDNAIKENTDLSPDDYDILISSVANQSTNKINYILDEAKVDNAKFNSEVHKLIEKERAKRNEIKKEKASYDEREKTLLSEKEILESRLTKIEGKLTKESQERLKQQYELDSIKKEQSDKIVQRKKINKRLTYSLLVLLVSSVIFFTVYFYKDIIKWVKYLMGLIAGLGGLWGFVSLILNLIKSLKLEALSKRNEPNSN